MTAGLIAEPNVAVSKSVERRRYGRIRLDVPLPARFGDAKVRVVELSMRGFLAAHEGRIAPAETRRLLILGDGANLEVSCTITRSTLWRLAKSMGETSIYHSGLRIAQITEDSSKLLRNMIAERVLRALDEQKANAHGLPPIAAYMYQPGKGELFRRCEFVSGVWRKSETIRDAQPANGFTVSADVDPDHVEMLCRTWEATTAEGRRLTQLLAELSISPAEGVPVRRYVP